jgi:hypothetical protein
MLFCLCVVKIHNLVASVITNVSGEATYTFKHEGVGGSFLLKYLKELHPVFLYRYKLTKNNFKNSCKPIVYNKQHVSVGKDHHYAVHKYKNVRR